MENTKERTSMSPLTKNYPGPNEDEEICIRGPTVMKGIRTTILYLMVNQTVYTGGFGSCVVEESYRNPNENGETCIRGPTVMKGICTTILYLMVNQTVYTSGFGSCVV